MNTGRLKVVIASFCAAIALSFAAAERIVAADVARPSVTVDPRDDVMLNTNGFASDTSWSQASRPSQIGVLDPNFGQFVYDECPSELCGVHRFAIGALINLSWSGWGEAEATASGTFDIAIESHDPVVGAVSPLQTQVPVTVVASGIKTCVGYRTYARLGIELAPGTPEPFGFRQMSTRDFPCRVVAAGDARQGIPLYFPGLKLREPLPGGGTIDEKNGSCLFYGIEPLVISDTSTVFCRMRWRAWGSRRARGVGVIDGFHFWPVEVEMSRIRWCPRYGLNYTRMRVTRYGKGVDLDLDGPISRRVANRLIEQIDRPNVKRRTHRLKLRDARGCL